MKKSRMRYFESNDNCLLWFNSNQTNSRKRKKLDEFEEEYSYTPKSKSHVISDPNRLRPYLIVPYIILG